MSDLDVNEINPDFPEKPRKSAGNQRNAWSMIGDATKDDAAASSHSDILFRHSGWKQKRKLLLASLNRTNQLARFNRVSSCGSKAYVYRHRETGEVRTQANFCRDKCCLPCSVGRATLIGDTVRARVNQKDAKYIHVTLTLKHSHQTPLGGQIDRLLRCTTKLRSSKLWKTSIIGGIIATEITRSKDSTWHVHAHVIAEAKASATIDAKALSDVWKKITKDSDVVKLSPIPDSATAGFVFGRYISKPISKTVLEDQDALDEFVTATAGRRTITTFGSWWGLELLKPNRDPISEEQWTCLGSLRSVLARGLYDRSLAHVRRYLEMQRTVLTRPPPRPVEAF